MVRRCALLVALAGFLAPGGFTGAEETAAPAWPIARSSWGRAIVVGPERDLQPIPPALPFPLVAGFDAPTHEDILHEIAAFSDTSRVAAARERLIARFGLAAAPALGEALAEGTNRTVWWNAALVVGALREAWGPAYELHRYAVPPLVARLAGDHEEWVRAFAALGIGAFPWNEIDERDTVPVNANVVKPAEARREAKRSLAQARRLLGEQATDPSAQASAAALLALAKMGGTEARDIVAALPVDSYRNMIPRRACLLARALLGVPSGAPILASLATDVQQVEAATAAFAIAIACLVEAPPDWTQDVEPLADALAALENRSQPYESAEGRFARLVLLRDGPLAERLERDSFDLLLLPTTDAMVAGAIAQALVHSQAAWLDDLAAEKAANAPRGVRPAVLPFLFLRGTQGGKQPAFRAAMEWLQRSSTRPRPGDEGDPRPLAIVGMLRSIVAGPPLAMAVRVELLAAIEKSLPAKPDGAFGDAVRAFLAAHGDGLRGESVEQPPADALVAVERAAPDPHHLLGTTLRDTALVRLDAMLDNIFNLDALPPARDDDRKTFQGERHLAGHWQARPYFGRLDFLIARGRRERAPRPADARLVLDR